MSRLLESFEFLNRGWDVRVLENMSLRKAFLFVLLAFFTLGVAFTEMLFVWLWKRHISLLDTAGNLVYLALACRYARAIYRRLEA